jgi:energy-coupling factor transporter ATP-binding protein EcfA2
MNKEKNYFGNYIRKNLDDLQDLVKHQWDGVSLIVGDEGDGKTTLVKLMAWYVDNNININKVAFNAAQFEEAVDIAESFSSLIWDESDDLSGHWASVMIQTLKRKFKRIRSKHLFIWLVTPTFFDMNKYWSIHRARCLWHVYAQPSRDQDGKFHSNRGRVRFFNKDKKRLLYFGGIKTWNMYAVHPDFVDAFLKVPDDYPITEAEYDAKKDAATKMVSLDESKHNNPATLRRTVIERLPRWFDNNRNKRKIMIGDFSWIMNVSEKTIDNDLRFLKKNSYKESIEPETLGKTNEIREVNREVNISSLEQETKKNNDWEGTP